MTTHSQVTGQLDNASVLSVPPQTSKKKGLVLVPMVSTLKLFNLHGCYGTIANYRTVILLLWADSRRNKLGQDE